MLDELDIDAETDNDEDLSEDEESRESPTRKLRRLITQAGAGLLFLAALYGLFWNEGQGRRDASTLIAAAGDVHSVQGTQIDPALNGRLVHVSAPVSSHLGVQDEVFGLRSNGVGLYRHVEMYQWIEYEYEDGRGRNRSTQREYELDWDDEYHDSSRFQESGRYRNPAQRLASAIVFAEDARIGPYRFDNEAIVHDAMTSLFHQQVTGRPSPNGLEAWLQPVESLPQVPDSLRRQRWYRISEDTYYRGDESSDLPELGDLTANFIELRNDFQLSIVALQDGEHLRPWADGSGRERILVVAGARSADAMLRAEAERVGSRTSLLRMIGLAAAVLGAAGVAAWLTGFLVAVPVLGPCVQYAAAAVAGVLGLVAGLLAIALGWLVAHPLVGIAFCVGVAALIVLGMRTRSKRPARSKPGPAERQGGGAQPSATSPALATAGAAATLAAAPACRFRSREATIPIHGRPAFRTMEGHHSGRWEASAAARLKVAAAV